MDAEEELERLRGRVPSLPVDLCLSIFDLPTSPLASPLPSCPGMALQGPRGPGVIPGHVFAMGWGRAGVVSTNPIPIIGSAG